MILEGFVLQHKDDEILINFLNYLGESQEQILGYHYPFYSNMLQHIGVGEKLNIGLKNEEGDLIAYLPGCIKKYKDETVYSSMPFFGPNGGVICDFNSVDVEFICDFTLTFLFEYLKNLNIISASIFTPFNKPGLIDVYQKCMPESIFVNKTSSFIPLENFELTNEHVDSSALRNVRKGLKSGIIIKDYVTNEEIEIIYSIYVQNCFDYGIPVKPKEVFVYLINDKYAKEHVKVYKAEYEGKIIGALVLIYSMLTISYYVPCSLHEYRNLQPNACLIAHALDEGIKAGIKFWNWESSPSKESGVYKFKKKWGSIDVEYGIIIKTFKEIDYYSRLGKEKIESHYPFFFVYPFTLIEK